MWNANEYRVIVDTASDELSGVADQVAVQVFRTDLSQPGFALLDLGIQETPSNFRCWLVQLAGRLSESYRRDFGSPLAILSASSFDQQASTGAHRDGGPEESILVLGYEKTEVSSRIFLLDYTRCALDRGMTPQEFLSGHNPMARDTRELLDPYTTELEEFKSSHFQILVINNSALSYEQRQRGMLGVLHKAVIPEARLGRSRVINSLMLAPAGTEGQELTADSALQLLLPVK